MASIKKVFVSALLSLMVLSCTKAGSPEYAPGNIKVFTNKAEIIKPEVINIPSNNFNERPADQTINTIVLHHTSSATDANRIGQWFATPEAKVSSHYTVDRTGYIVQSVDDSKRAWHAGKSSFMGTDNVNDFSIGIEICNLGDNNDPYPEAEYNSIINLVAYLVRHYNIPLERITRHRDVALPLGRKDDTSDNFSVKKVLDGVTTLLNGETIAPAPISPVPSPFPEFRVITSKINEKTLKEIAENYLDNENRWLELKIVNPELNPDKIKTGTKIKLPTDFRYSSQGK